MEKIIQKGAEAEIILKDRRIIKHRIKKSYRLIELDEKLRKRRTKKESKVMKKVSGLIPLPKIFSSLLNEKKIEMEFIQGEKLSNCLNNLKNKKNLGFIIGKQIAKLHELNIIHGDLTTSNMILSENKIFFIDFGLSYNSPRIEDKAVDLHLIKQALKAKHFEYSEKIFQKVLEGYCVINNNGWKIINQLKKVEKRGRYKAQY